MLKLRLPSLVEVTRDFPQPFIWPNKVLALRFWKRNPLAGVHRAATAGRSIPVSKKIPMQSRRNSARRWGAHDRPLGRIASVDLRSDQAPRHRVRGYAEGLDTARPYR